MIAIKPDIKFKKALMESSGSSLSECMQCGNCSAVCSLAPEERPFPRKEMIWAAWGLKDKLIANPDLWLCHQCGDCSSYCPRDVKPADVLASVRQQSYLQFARPAFMGKLLSKPAWLPVAILIPVLIISAILMLAGTFTIPEGSVNYSKFFPHAWLNGSFSLLFLISYGIAATGFVKFYRQMKSHFPDSPKKTSFWKSVIQVKLEVLRHSKFADCNSQKTRRTAHFLVFYGFALLLLVTLYAIVAVIIGAYPLALSNPFKIIGNLASVMLLVGLGIFIYIRLFDKRVIGKSTYPDWLLLISFFLLTLSGILVQFARFENWGFAYHFYFFHLLCVWFVIIYLPYTKFAHMVYRFIALTFANGIGRK